VDVSEAITILILHLYELFHHALFDMQRWEEDSITIDQRFIYHIVLPHHKFFTYVPILSLPVLISSSAIPQTKKA